MNTVSNDSPKPIANFTSQIKSTLLPIVKSTLIPLVNKISAGSILTWSHPQDLAVSFIAQKCFSELGNMGISQLQEKLQLSTTLLMGLAYANLGLSFFAGHQAAQRMGYNPSFAGMSVGTMVNLAVEIYQYTLSMNEETFKDTDKITAVTEQNFQEEVENSALPVILDVYATWCPPCKMVAPIFAKLAEEMEGQVKFVKMNIDNETNLATKLKVKAMPTFLFFKDGKEVHRREGAVQREYFVDQIKLLKE